MKINKEISDYSVVNKDGKSFHQTNRMEITSITEKSYVGNLYNLENICIAQDRRFFFENAIHDQLSDGEKGMIKNEIPGEKWSVPEIKLYLDSKEIKYNMNDNKQELFTLLEIKIEEVV